jgi:hypothetical protein
MIFSGIRLTRCPSGEQYLHGSQFPFPAEIVLDQKLEEVNRKVRLTVFWPSTTNLSNWKNWLMTVCLCHDVSFVLSALAAEGRRLVGFQCGRSKMDTPYLPLIKSCPQAPYNITDLQQAQALQSLLDQFLYSPFLCDVLVLAKRVPCLTASIFTEIVIGKLSRMAQKGAELNKVEREKHVR